MALGLSVIFGVVRVVNFAHGEMVTIAMYAATVLFAVLMTAGPMIKPGDLGIRSAKDSGGGRLEDMSLEDVECFLIKKAMTRYDGNVSQAAKALGLSRSALYRRLQRYGL